MLKINNLCAVSDAGIILDDISLTVMPGTITALLGPNGAGKSELVQAVAGVLPLKTGAVAVEDHFINGKPTDQIRAAGVAAVPEGHQVLRSLSVIDNLRAAGAHLSRSELETEVTRAFHIFPEFDRLEHQAAGTLSGGQQQMVAIAQALVCRPKYLLIDEMSLGLAPVIIDRLIDVVQKLRNDGLGILLIEQFTQLAIDVSDQCYVISSGAIQFEGPPEQLKQDPTILERAYLHA